MIFLILSNGYKLDFNMSNEEYELSDEAAALSCTLRNNAEDVADGLPMPTPLTNETLTRACALLNAVASANLLDGVPDAAALRENGIYSLTMTTTSRSGQPGWSLASIYIRLRRGCWT